MFWHISLSIHFQVKILEDEKNKARSDVEAKDKQVKEKTEAEKKATDELNKLTKEKVK